MQSRDFCYWLQGFFELSGQSDQITPEQATVIRRHLDLVFAHELRPALRGRPEPPTPRPMAPPAPAPLPPPEPAREDSPPLVPPEPPRC